MFSFNLKISVQKYPISGSSYNSFSANVSDFYTHFATKNQKFQVLISLQKSKYIITF